MTHSVKMNECYATQHQIFVPVENQNNIPAGLLLATAGGPVASNTSTLKNGSVNSCWCSDFAFLGPVRKYVLVSQQLYSNGQTHPVHRRAQMLRACAQGGVVVRKKICPWLWCHAYCSLVAILLQQDFSPYHPKCVCACLAMCACRQALILKPAPVRFHVCICSGYGLIVNNCM